MVSLQAKADEDSKTLEETIAADTNIEDHMEKIEMKKLVKSNLTFLSPKQRMVVILRYFEDLSYEEIAEALKAPLGTVKTELFRARNILRNKLASAMEV